MAQFPPGYLFATNAITPVAAGRIISSWEALKTIKRIKSAKGDHSQEIDTRCTYIRNYGRAEIDTGAIHTPNDGQRAINIGDGRGQMEAHSLIRREMQPSVWKMIQEVSVTLHESRLFGVSSAAQATAICLKGYELGLGLTGSFEFIAVVQGKPTLSPRGALAIVLNSGLCGGLKIVETDTECSVWMRRKGEPPIEFTTSWSQADTEQAGLNKVGGAHVTYPKNMRRWRAVGFCIDVLFSDVCGGMKRADELGASVNADGDVIDAIVTDSANAQTSSAGAVPVVQPPPVPATVSLDELLQTYSAEEIIVANQGTIPGTDDELRYVATILAADHAHA